jgi:hypothetical protein
LLAFYIICARALYPDSQGFQILIPGL